MAQQKRKTSAKRTYHKKKKQIGDNRLKGEIILLLVFAVCILAMLSSFGLGGPAGKAFSSLFFGLFGLLAYVFPVLFFFSFAFLSVNRKNPMAKRKTVGLWGIFLFACAFFQMILIGNPEDISVLEFYGNCAFSKSGGGLVGGALVRAFTTAFGTVGAYLIIIIGLIIFAIVMTQKPLLATLKESGTQAYEAARTRYALRQKALEEERIRQAAVENRRKKALKQNEADGNAAGKGKNAADAERKASVPAMEEIRIDLPEDAVMENDQEKFPKDILISGVQDAEEDSAQTPLMLSLPDVNTFTGNQISDEPTIYDEEKINDPFSAGQTITNAEETADTEENPISAETGNMDAGTPKKITAKDTAEAVGEIRKELGTQEEPSEEYVYPPVSLLHAPDRNRKTEGAAQLKETASKLQETLHSFGVEVTISHISCGPTVTRYEMHPQQGVKVSKIVSLADDIKLNLAAADIRIEAPIPGKAAIGIEVPNKTNMPVLLRELLESAEFRRNPSCLAFAVGKDIAGQPVIADIAKMPHLLIAGATGSGKSVCINTLIMSILYKSPPEEVKFIMIDPKVVELSIYNGIPHLLIPVVTDPKKAAGALNWTVAEMTDRYQRFAEYGARDLKSYNERIDELPESEDGKKPRKLPRIIVIVDELADLMMVAQNEVEDAIVRLTQLARAAGIHLIIATQRPSVNVITGLIKANMPSRIALSVTSGVDSRTILDMNGAEKLLGRGDMLFYPQGYQKPARVQGAFLSDEEIAKVVRFLKEHRFSRNDDQILEAKITESISAKTAENRSEGAGDTDAYFPDAGKLIISKDKASIGMLQRAFRIGFNRAARIMDQLSDAGVVGEEEGTKPRKILMTMDEFEHYLEEH